MAQRIRYYKELKRLPTFIERYEYLRIGGIVGESTFGFDRYLNQMLYNSAQWRRVRDAVIIRDEGCDLGIEGMDIRDRIYIHHMNPITIKQIADADPVIFDPEYLVCVSRQTHNAIHFGDQSLLPHGPVERRPGDTCLWK